MDSKWPGSVEGKLGSITRGICKQAMVGCVLGFRFEPCVTSNWGSDFGAPPQRPPPWASSSNLRSVSYLSLCVYTPLGPGPRYTPSSCPFAPSGSHPRCSAPLLDLSRPCLLSPGFQVADTFPKSTVGMVHDDPLHRGGLVLICFSND